MALDIVQLEVGLLQNFCEVIGCTETGEAALVDPAFEVDRLLAIAEERDWRIRTILLTHTHSDHIDGLAEAFAATDAVVRCHPVEAEVARRHAGRVQPVADDEQLTIGTSPVRAIHAPGHTPGCVCFYLVEERALIAGDVLFVGSCGGLHFPSSDARAMYQTLQERILTLPEETIIYPGHDYGDTPISTLDWELHSNRALSAHDFEEFCRRMRVKRPAGRVR